MSSSITLISVEGSTKLVVDGRVQQQQRHEILNDDPLDVTRHTIDSLAFDKRQAQMHHSRNQHAHHESPSLIEYAGTLDCQLLLLAAAAMVLVMCLLLYHAANYRRRQLQSQLQLNQPQSVRGKQNSDNNKKCDRQMIQHIGSCYQACTKGLNQLAASNYQQQQQLTQTNKHRSTHSSHHNNASMNLNDRLDTMQGRELGTGALIYSSPEVLIEELIVTNHQFANECNADVVNVVQQHRQHHRVITKDTDGHSIKIRLHHSNSGSSMVTTQPHTMAPDDSKDNNDKLEGMSTTTTTMTATATTLGGMKNTAYSHKLSTIASDSSLATNNTSGAPSSNESDDHCDDNEENDGDDDDDDNEHEREHDGDDNYAEAREKGKKEKEKEKEGRGNKKCAHLKLDVARISHDLKLNANGVSVDTMQRFGRNHSRQTTTTTTTTMVTTTTTTKSNKSRRRFSVQDVAHNNSHTQSIDSDKLVIDSSLETTNNDRAGDLASDDNDASDESLAASTCNMTLINLRPRARASRSKSLTMGLTFPATGMLPAVAAANSNMSPFVTPTFDLHQKRQRHTSQTSTSSTTPTTAISDDHACCYNHVNASNDAGSHGAPTPVSSAASTSQASQVSLAYGTQAGATCIGRTCMASTGGATQMASTGPNIRIIVRQFPPSTPVTGPRTSLSSLGSRMSLRMKRLVGDSAPTAPPAVLSTQQVPRYRVTITEAYNLLANPDTTLMFVRVFKHASSSTTDTQQQQQQQQQQPLSPTSLLPAIMRSNSITTNRGPPSRQASVESDATQASLASLASLTSLRSSLSQQFHFSIDANDYPNTCAPQMALQSWLVRPITASITTQSINQGACDTQAACVVPASVVFEPPLELECDEHEFPLRVSLYQVDTTQARHSRHTVGHCFVSPTDWTSDMLILSAPSSSSWSPVSSVSLASPVYRNAATVNESNINNDNINRRDSHDSSDSCASSCTNSSTGSSSLNRARRRSSAQMLYSSGALAPGTLGVSLFGADHADLKVRCVLTRPLTAAAPAAPASGNNNSADHQQQHHLSYRLYQTIFDAIK